MIFWTKALQNKCVIKKDTKNKWEMENKNTWLLPGIFMYGTE